NTAQYLISGQPITPGGLLSNAASGAAISTVTAGALNRIPASNTINRLGDEIPTAGIAPDYQRLATQHVTNSGDTVLGHHPGYIQKAQERGASYFDVGDEWDNIVARGDDPWQLNRAFLDDRIAARDRILLSLPKQDVRPGSYLEEELQYLTDNNYHWVNQWSLHPND
ncbi:MAG: Rhs family protein, partial [Microbacterium sp.]|nr:Rhs family protein [Microbacterium sp.]